ncbi:MAG: methyltransferase domain-containing protein [Bryobacteraceae bacterium]
MFNQLMTLSKPLPKSLLVAMNIGRNGWARLRFAMGHVDSSNGATHRKFSLSDSLAYINRVFVDYLTHAGITAGELRGKRILEIGPGDSLGVAVRFLAAGAAQVVSIDKFFSRRDPVQQHQIYRAMREQLSPPDRAGFDSVVTLSPALEFNRDRLRYVYGHGIEDADDALAGAPFDCAVSRAVLEEIDDLDQVLAKIDGRMRPGGMQVHRIDFRDYGMFSRHGHHPLEFLTVSDLVYRHGMQFARPNRRLIDYYRTSIEALGYDAKLFPTRVVGSAEELEPGTLRLEKGVHYTEEMLAGIKRIRPRLLPRYRMLSDEDLLIAGVMLAARKAERV